jgi:ketosteroid isomerase-like protein
MSEENVEMVRRGYEAYARGDVDVLLEGNAPDLVVYRRDPDGATFHGPEGLLEAIGEWVEDFDEFALAAREFIDANDEQVVVRVHQKAVAAQSGAPVEGEFWFVHTIRDGRFVRLDMFAEKAHAGSCRPRARRDPEVSAETNARRVEFEKGGSTRAMGSRGRAAVADVRADARRARAASVGGRPARPPARRPTPASSST